MEIRAGGSRGAGGAQVAGDAGAEGVARSREGHRVRVPGLG